MKRILILLMLLLAFTVVTRADTNCWPATCPYGSHSVCEKVCDPDKGPACIPVCKCHCEKDPPPPPPPHQYMN
jgi:hypothetical protein